MKSKIFPIAFIIFLTGLMFFKVFLKEQYPVPADLLVSFYFPYYSGGWEGYNPWTTHKELLNADAIRQIYLWKEFAANQFKDGRIPLWNPYTFSGQPLLANFQSSVFYPLNVFYFLTSPQNAWILLVVVQPLLAGAFMYLLLLSFKIKTLPAIFSSMAFMFSSYLVSWMENVNIGHSYIWLPVSFWAINKYFKEFKLRYLLILIVSLALSIFGGHPQTAIYIFFASSLFWIYQQIQIKHDFIKNSAAIAASLFLALALSAIQIIPTYAFYKTSPISLPFSKEVFEKGIMPIQNLVTFFASDFFGHPANNNFWSFSYGDFTPYFGVIPLVFALWAPVSLWKNPFVKFATASSILFILLATKSPLNTLIQVLQIPILDSTASARFISITIFFLVILSALGIGDFLQNFQKKQYFKKFLVFLVPLALIYLILWGFAWQAKLTVTIRNLILPTIMFLSIPLGTMAVKIISRGLRIDNATAYRLLVLGIFISFLTGGIYYTNKFLPTAPKNFIFPQHPLFTHLKENAGINRFYGGGTAHVDFNFPTHYQIYGAEGYDSLRIERYAQLLASGFEGKVPETYLRSDAVFANEPNDYRKRLFDLLGVKYLLDKEDNPKSNADWHYERFAGDKVSGIWQEGKFQVYRRETVLPRIFQTTSYQVASDEQIIAKIYDPNFNLQTILLEKDPTIKIEKTDPQIAIPQILEYRPGSINIETNTAFNSLLFISDAHDPDWKVRIDGRESQLLRAHYALMAAAVPKGVHIVEFLYDPPSFKWGLAITASAAVMLSLLSFYTIRTKRF